LKKIRKKHGTKEERRGRGEREKKRKKKLNTASALGFGLRNYASFSSNIWPHSFNDYGCFCGCGEAVRL